MFFSFLVPRSSCFDCHEISRRIACICHYNVVVYICSLFLPLVIRLFLVD